MPKKSSKVQFDLEDDHSRIPMELRNLTSLYTHHDPLIKRLRLDDPYGRPIDNIGKAFEGKEVVVFFVGSEFGDNNLKELHRDLTELQMTEYKWLQVIYISTDSSPSVISRICHNKPYLRLTPHDDSDFAPLARSESEALARQTEVGEVARDEAFVMAEEVEMRRVVWREGEEEKDASAYARPFSRAALTHILLSLSTPSLAIYHIPSHRFLARNVTPSAFRPGPIRDRKLREWKGGNATGVVWWDVWMRLKFPILLAFMVIMYHLAVVVFGEEYNVIPQIVSALQGGQGGSGNGNGVGDVGERIPRQEGFAGFPIGS